MALDQVAFKALRVAGLTANAAKIILAQGGAGIDKAAVLALLQGLVPGATVVQVTSTPVANTTITAGGTPVGNGVYVQEPGGNIYGPTNSSSQITTVTPVASSASAVELVSPNGTHYVVSVDDTGHLITTAVGA